MKFIECSCILQNFVLRSESEIETGYILTLDSYICCGIHCWCRCVNHWLAGVQPSMGCVQRAEWEGESGGWTSGSLSPHCDVTAIHHHSAVTGIQPLNSRWYIRLKSTGQVVGLPRCWYTRVHDGNIVQQLCTKKVLYWSYECTKWTSKLYVHTILGCSILFL